MNTEDLEKIIVAGIAAPSADNSQPWRYRYDGACLDLWLDPQRARSPSNADYVLSDLALGAVIENICLQADALGYQTQVSVFPDLTHDPRWVARIQLEKANAPGTQPLGSAIPLRHTDRRFPFKGPVPDHVQQTLIEQACHHHGCNLALFREPARRNAALKAIRLAETLRFRYQALHSELFSHIRWEAGWHQGCPEGLSPATLAVEAPMRPLFKALRHWKTMTALNRFGASTLLGFRAAYLPARLSPLLGLLMIRDTDRTGMITAGRALQRVWLQATVAGLAIQPYAAAGLFSLGRIELNKSFEQDIHVLQGLMTELCPPEWQGLIFLRMGYPPTSTPVRNGRRPASEFLAT